MKAKRLCSILWIALSANLFVSRKDQPLLVAFGFSSAINTQRISLIPAKRVLTSISEQVSCRVTTRLLLTSTDPTRSDPTTNEKNLEHDTNRRSEFRTAALSLAISVLLATTADPASAITREYPAELTYGYVGVNSQRQIAEQRTSQQRQEAIQKSLEDPLKTRDAKDLATTVVWSTALWLGLGSRSNFLVKPLANLLYDTNAQQPPDSTSNSTNALTDLSSDESAFVRDRNDGYFSDIPFELSFILAAVFIFSGWALNRLLTLVVLKGDADLNLQLAGVTLISAGALELGRIASGEKSLTRQEADRERQLIEEFDQFANDRLVLTKGGNVHRTEVCASFRRFYSKYRYTNSSQDLNDLEIERLMRSWNMRLGSKEDMSRAGFFLGVQLNKNADIVTAQDSTTQTIRQTHRIGLWLS